MEIIAMGDLRQYLKQNLSKFENPVIFISSDFIPGCPKCNSSASVYYVKLMEFSKVPKKGIEEAKKHKFPIPIFVKYPILKGRPKQIVIGTKKSKGELQLVLRRVLD